MALLTSSKAPSVSAEAVAAGMRALVPQGSLAPLGRNVAFEDLSVAAPIAVYEVDTENFRGGLLATAKSSRWRMLLLQGTTAVGWVSHAADGVSDVTVNDYAAALVEAVRMGEQLAQKTDYELRILESRGHGLGAVWLHAPGSDVIIPALAAGRVEPFRAYDEATLAASLGDPGACLVMSS